MFEPARHRGDGQGRRVVPAPRAGMIAALAGVLALAVSGPARAAVPSGNLLGGGAGAEEGPAAANAVDVRPPGGGWVSSPGFTQVAYGAGAFPSAAVSLFVGGGTAFFAGGPDVGFSTADREALIAYVYAHLPGAIRRALPSDVNDAKVRADVTAYLNETDAYVTPFATINGVSLDAKGSSKVVVYPQIDAVLSSNASFSAAGIKLGARLPKLRRR